MKSIAHLFAFVAALVLVLLGFFYLDVLRALLAALNGRIVDVLLGSASWSSQIMLRPVVLVGLLIIEGFVATLIVAAIIESPFKGRASRESLRYVFMTIAFFASLYFGAYVYSVLWGDVMLWGSVIMAAYDPARLTFSMGGSLGIVGAWYGVSQAVPLVFRPRVGIVWPMIQLVSSFVPFAIVVAALGNYWFGSYPWTGYRLTALQIWTPIEIIDVVVIAINLRLLTRGFLGGVSEEAVIEGGMKH